MSAPSQRTFRQDKFVKDAKMLAAGFAVLVIIPTHWAWTMKQFLVDRDASWLKTIVLLGGFFLTAVSLVYVLAKVVYPRIYNVDDYNVGSAKKEQ